MANQLSVQLSLDASGYTQGIEKAAEKTREYTNQVTKISKDLPNLTREMRSAQRETLNLTLAVSRLTEEQRNSAEGQAMIRMLEETKQRAADLTDMLYDTRDQIRNMASDTLDLDAATDAVSILGNTFSSLEGTIALVTGDTDKMKKAVTAFTTVQSTLNAATSIGNAIQKQSALITVLSTKYTNLKKIATNAATLAEIGHTAATNKGKIGQNAFNVALAVGKALLGDWKSLLLAAGVAVGGYAAITAMTAEDTKKLEEEEKKAKKEEEALMNAQNQHADMIRDKYINTVADLRYKYDDLKNSYKQLKTEKEKSDWIKNNQEGFKQLGFTVKGVDDANKLLIDNADEMIEYFDLVGQAAALAALKIEAYQEAARLKLLQKEHTSKLGSQFSAGSQLDASTASRYGLKYGSDYEWKNPNGVHDKIVLTAEGAAKANAESVKQSSVTKKNNDEIAKQEERIKSIKEEELAITQKQQEVIKRIGVLQAGSTSSSSSNGDKTNGPTKEEIQKRANELSQYYENNPIKITIDYSEAEIKDKIKRLQTKLENTPVKINGVFNPERDKIKGEIETWQEELKPKKSIVDEEEFTNSITRGIEFSKKALQDWDDAQTRSKEQKLEEFNQIGEGIQTIGGMMTSISQLTDDKAINIMAIVGQAVANVALGFSKALAKEGKLGVWDWIAAAATGLATMVSVQQVIKQQTSGYATGGVVGGNSYTGDNLLVRVNSKERILTAKQNKALNDGLAQINSFGQVGRLYGTVTVKGSDLNIAMKNFNKTQKKSR